MRYVWVTSILLLLSCSLAFGVSPIIPVTYSWTIRPAPNPPWVTFRFDTCHVTLKSTENASAYVILYYFPPPFGSATGAQGLETPVQFPATTPVLVDREVPYNIPCPCLVCVVQDCPNGSTHTQCGYVLRPGEALPPGWWTPFSQIALLPVCPVPPNVLFSDGFEAGSLRRWVPWEGSNERN